MKLIKKALAAMAALGLGLSVLSAHAEDKTIKLGTMSWEDILPITGVAKKALEDKGYKVEVTPFSEWGIAYAALTKGDVEVLVSEVDYVARDYWDKNKNKLEKISIASHGLYQAFAVPSYVDIKSIEGSTHVRDNDGPPDDQSHAHRLDDFVLAAARLDALADVITHAIVAAQHHGGGEPEQMFGVHR